MHTSVWSRDVKCNLELLEDRLDFKSIWSATVSCSDMLAHIAHWTMPRRVLIHAVTFNSNIASVLKGQLWLSTKHVVGEQAGFVRTKSTITKPKLAE